LKIFDLNRIDAFDIEQKEKNVFYQKRNFKVRIIALPPGGQMPTCDMKSHVIFYILEGTGVIHAGFESAELKKGECFIAEPSQISMNSDNGVKILGIQVSD